MLAVMPTDARSTPEAAARDRPATVFALLKEKRQELLDRWVQRINSPRATEPLSQSELIDHIPLFVDELIASLFPDAVPFPGRPAESAEEHGAQRLRLGFNVGEVVREYGMLHACILD